MNNLSDISGSEATKNNRKIEGTDLNKILTIAEYCYLKTNTHTQKTKHDTRQVNFLKILHVLF